MDSNLQQILILLHLFGAVLVQKNPDRTYRFSDNSTFVLPSPLCDPFAYGNALHDLKLQLGLVQENSPVREHKRRAEHTLTPELPRIHVLSAAELSCLFDALRPIKRETPPSASVSTKAAVDVLRWVSEISPSSSGSRAA